MDKEQSLSLCAKGREAWNEWASERVVVREIMERDGDWETEVIDISGDIEPANDVTRIWMDASSSIFQGHEFKDFADFSGFVFPWHASFDCGGGYYLDSISTKFPNGANFSSASFLGDARFDEAIFAEQTNFIATRFADRAIFNCAKFTGNVTFENAIFEKVASFTREVAFLANASFENTNFLGDAHFKKCKFGDSQNHNNFSFRLAKFHKFVTFENTTFDGNVSFHGAVLVT